MNTRAPVVIALMAILAFVAACRRSEHAPIAATSPPIRVRLETVEAKKVPATEDVAGTIQPKLRATLEAKISGRIEKMLVDPGQRVKSGELLVLLDAREIQARLDQAIAQRDQFARDAERLQRLLANSAVSRQEFETVESRHQIAIAAVIETETLLGYTRVTAPFSGVITRKLTDVGDLASSGKPLLEMEDPAALRLEANVPESLIARVEPGAKLAVSVSQFPAAFGTVREIAPTADPASRTFLVKLDLPPTSGLRSGLFARVAIPTGESMTLRVPTNAVVQKGQMELLFIAADNRAQMRLVKTGKRIDDRIEIVSGLDAGERVVVEGTAELRDGQLLETL